MVGGELVAGQFVRLGGGLRPRNAGGHGVLRRWRRRGAPVPDAVGLAHPDRGQPDAHGDPVAAAYREAVPDKDACRDAEAVTHRHRRPDPETDPETDRAAELRADHGSTAADSDDDGNGDGDPHRGAHADRVDVTDACRPG